MLHQRIRYYYWLYGAWLFPVLTENDPQRSTKKQLKESNNYTYIEIRKKVIIWIIV